MFIRELFPRPQIDFSSRHTAAHFHFPVQWQNKFHDPEAWAAAQPFASPSWLP
jgi:hypothetical protein